MSASTFGRKHFFGGVTLAVALWAWPMAGFSYTMEQQQACMGDAFRLCGSEIPDVERVTMCMVRRQAELSPGCRVHFRAPEPVASARSRSVSRAAHAHHMRKVRQSRRYDDSDLD
jgi:hypothetical protein